MRQKPIHGIRTSNESERSAVEFMTSKGYEVLKRGWPDFIAFKDGRVRFVEVKPTCKSRLKKEQKQMAEILGTLGIKVEIMYGSCVCGKGCLTSR